MLNGIQRASGFTSGCSSNSPGISKIAMNKIILRGVLFSGLATVLAFYEAFTHVPVRLELIAGYALVFLYGILVIMGRKHRERVMAAEQSNSDE